MSVSHYDYTNHTLTIFILGIFTAINIIGFVLMGVDKIKSKTDSVRISEATFFVLSLFGGSLGTWAGMYVFRHKTKHLTFVIGIPLILFLQAALIIYLKFIR